MNSEKRKKKLYKKKVSFNTELTMDNRYIDMRQSKTGTKVKVSFFSFFTTYFFVHVMWNC